jgi:hypothetical protein
MTSNDVRGRKDVGELTKDGDNIVALWAPMLLTMISKFKRGRDRLQCKARIQTKAKDQDSRGVELTFIGLNMNTSASPRE